MTFSHATEPDIQIQMGDSAAASDQSQGTATFTGRIDRFDACFFDDDDKL